jgi:putative transposase
MVALLSLYGSLFALLKAGEASFGLNGVRARATFSDPGLRLLFVGIALLLVNMWIYLKWAVLGVPRRGGQYVDDEFLPLARFKDFLLEAVKAIYGVALVIQRPRSPPYLLILDKFF